MNYPVWEVPYLGGSLLIALVAVVHVFISQFAVGGGLFLALGGRMALREQDPGLWDYLRTHARFFMVVTLLFGAVTGVGIWWTIGLISPQATSLLIRSFVWGWAIEWCFFLTETAAVLFYYYAWDKVDAATRQLFAWIYAVSAFLTLAVINGIVSFMLTPGRWLETQAFWDGILNPSYLPSLVMRSAVSAALAGLYGMVTAVRVEPAALRARLVRWAAGWVLVAFAVLPLGAAWYVAVIPAPARELALGGAAPVSIMFLLSLVISLLILAAVFFGPWRQPARVPGVLVGLVLALGLLATGGTEWVREGIRKPYIIYGYLYTNGIYAQDAARLAGEPVLDRARWALVSAVEPGREQAAGREVFRVECMSCHTVDGYNGVRPLVRGWDAGFTVRQLEHLHRLKGYMPPFQGDPGERQALAEYLVSLND